MACMDQGSGPTALSLLMADAAYAGCVSAAAARRMRCSPHIGVCPALCKWATVAHAQALGRMF